MSDLIRRQDAIDALKEAFNPSITNFVKAKLAIENLPSALPEKVDTPTVDTPNCDDTISRQAAIDAILAVTGNSSVRELYEHVQEHGLSDMWSGGVNAAIDIIIAVPSAQPDISEYSDKLWKAAYERGKTKAQAEIVRCKDCKHSRFFDPCFYCYEFGEEINVPENGFCFMAERRTDG